MLTVARITSEVGWDQFELLPESSSPSMSAFLEKLQRDSANINHCTAGQPDERVAVVSAKPPGSAV